MSLARRLTAALVTAAALTLAVPTAAQARPVQEHEMDRSYTGPTGTRPAAKPLCASKSLIGYSCLVPRLYFFVLRFR